MATAINNQSTKGKCQQVAFAHSDMVIDFKESLKATPLGRASSALTLPLKS